MTYQAATLVKYSRALSNGTYDETMKVQIKNIYAATQSFSLGSVSNLLPYVSSFGDKWTSDLALFHFATDAIREMTESDIYVTNTGAFKNGFAKNPLTQGDLLAVMPYINTIETYYIRGTLIRRMLLTTFGLSKAKTSASPHVVRLQVNKA
jgi:2',3'-cyclic-nucleotide 2'-phosphodiesterase (5'-nucleotidase family)